MFRHMYHQDVAQLEKAVAELERLLGQDLPREAAATQPTRRPTPMTNPNTQTESQP